MDVGQITKNLNPKQKSAVTHGGGPLLIVAGAGTGKTTVLTQRFAWLVSQGLAKPEAILAVTFTDKAAEEMEDRVLQLLPYGYTDLWISTFHAFCQRILQAHGLDIGLPTDFKVLDSTSQWLLVHDHLDKFNLQYYKPLGNPTKFIHALLSHFSRAKDEAVSAKDYLKWVKRQQRRRKKNQTVDDGDAQEIERLAEVAQAYGVYQQLLVDNNALDFGDLINYTLQLFQQRPNILKQYQGQFKYILVDEFQDTNWAQYQLLKLLAKPQDNITVVGDDDQAIYRFRGASVSNILEFRGDYKKTQTVVLTDNYRSGQNILDVAYQFIQHNNPDRLEVAPGQKIDKRLTAHQNAVGQIDYQFYNTGAAETTGLIEKILEIKKNDPQSRWSDFAILLRANNQAKPFIAALERAGLPYQFFALRGLYGKEVILDVVSYLKLLDNYHESPALWRVLNWPIWQISADDLVNLSHRAKAKSRSLYHSLQQAEAEGDYADKTLQAAKRLLDLISQHSEQARHKKPSEVYIAVLNQTGLLDQYKDVETSMARQNIAYLRQFYDKLKRFEEDGDQPTLKKFLQRLELERSAGEEGSLEFDIEAGPDVIRLMTIHAAKGLEFEQVFIPNLVHLRFPSIERHEPIELPDDLINEILPSGDIHLAEERRLMYVALTRAKKALYLSAARDYGGSRARRPSRFIEELGLTSQESTTQSTDRLIKTDDNQEVTAEKLPNLPLPKKFAFSQLSSYQKCPLQYKYAYVLKIPTFGKSNFSFGTSIHNTLQKFFSLMIGGHDGRQGDLFKTKQALPPLKKLLEIYDDCWVDDWYDDMTTKQQYYDKGKKILTTYHALLVKQVPQPIRLEAPFAIKIGDYQIGGRIDRMDLVEGGVEIVDYKTGRAKDKVADVDKDQLLIYQLAAKEAFGLQPKYLTYYYIEEQQALRFIGTAKDEENIKKKIITTIDKIKTQDFTATANPQICQHCDFRDICDFRAV